MSKVDQNPVYIACLAPSLAYIRHMSVLNLLSTSGVSPSRTNVKTMDCLVEAKKLVPVAKGPGLRGASLLNPGRRGARLGRDQQRRLERRVMSLSLSRHARATQNRRRFVSDGAGDAVQRRRGRSMCTGLRSAELAVTSAPVSLNLHAGYSDRPAMHTPPPAVGG